MAKYQELELSKLVEFANHPFKVIDDDEMNELVKSIKANGIMYPLIVRAIANSDTYEIISGHRRKRAAELAEMTKVPCAIEKLNDEEAIAYMVDTNLTSREKIDPSEKAVAYKMKLDAIKHQGKRTDLTSDRSGPTLRSNEELSKATKDSPSQIKRYIRLNELIPTLLASVDSDDIALEAAVEISYIKKEGQKSIHKILSKRDKHSLSIKEAKALREEDGKMSNGLTQSKVSEILSNPSKTHKAKTVAPVWRDFFPQDTPSNEIERVLRELLKRWKNEQSESANKLE